jgi:hypothetical protein
MTEQWSRAWAVRPAEPAGGTAVQSAPRPATATPPRGPRRVKVTLSRVDPWTALKVSFVFGLAALVILLVAVALLYGLVDAMGVLSSLRQFLDDIDSTSSGPGIVAWLSFGRIITVAAVLGALNVVLFSALATMGAFIYNVTGDVVGGVDLTLVERG